MKATLEFDLPEEREAHEAAVRGTDYMCALHGIDQWARGALKYGHEFKTADAVFERLREIIREEELPL